MDALPDHTRRLAERLLEAYCQRICPPEFREQVVLGWRVGTYDVTLHEVRRICGVPGTARLVDVALLRHDVRRASWRLFHRVDADDGGPMRWRRYPVAPQRSLSALMQAVDEDAYGLFWPRINGASLRWCSARGRCAGCAERYRSALGTVEPRRDEPVAIPIERQRGAG